MAERNQRPRRNSGRPSRPSSSRPSSSRPSSSRPSSSRPSSSRPSSSRSEEGRARRPFPKEEREVRREARAFDEKRSASKPPLRSRNERSDGERKSFTRSPASGRREDKRRDGRAERGGERSAKKPFQKKPGFGAPHQPRARIFEPELLEEITGENLEKSVRAELLSLSADNGAYVAKHLESVHYFSELDPERAYQHALAAAHHAGRLGVVRETAGYAAYRAGHFEVALRELRAAHRISGDVSMWPVMADCERGLGNPLKALKMAGSPEVRRLDKAEEIEMRIVAAGARRDLNEVEAAVVTLQCKELSNSKEPWAVRLRYAYADALAASGRMEEARQWFKKAADVDFDLLTDAAERS